MSSSYIPYVLPVSPDCPFLIAPSVFSNVLEMINFKMVEHKKYEDIYPNITEYIN